MPRKLSATKATNELVSRAIEMPTVPAMSSTIRLITASFVRLWSIAQILDTETGRARCPHRAALDLPTISDVLNRVARRAEDRAPYLELARELRQCLLHLR